MVKTNLAKQNIGGGGGWGSLLKKKKSTRDRPYNPDDPLPLKEEGKGSATADYTPPKLEIIQPLASLCCSFARARLSRSKERVWSKCILGFVVACPRNPWRVNWFIYRSDVL